MPNELELEIDTSQIDALISRFPQFAKLIYSEIDRAMWEALSILHEQVLARTPVNTGKLRQSIMPVVRGKAPDAEGEVVTSMVYGEPVEYGRRPGSMPPIRPIEMWVRRKLGISGNLGRQVAWRIAQKIRFEGFAGAFMFSEGFDAGKPDAEKVFAKVVDRATAKIEREMDKISHGTKEFPNE